MFFTHPIYPLFYTLPFEISWTWGKRKNSGVFGGLKIREGGDGYKNGARLKEKKNFVFLKNSMLNNLFKIISFASKNPKNTGENGNMFSIKNKILPNMQILRNCYH